MSVVIKTMNNQEFDIAAGISTGHTADKTERQKMKTAIMKLNVKQYIDVPKDDFCALRELCARKMKVTEFKFKCYKTADFYRILRTL